MMSDAFVISTHDESIAKLPVGWHGRFPAIFFEEAVDASHRSGGIDVLLY